MTDFEMDKTYTITGREFLALLSLIPDGDEKAKAIVENVAGREKSTKYGQKMEQGSEGMIVEKDTPWAVITGLGMTSDKMKLGEHEPHWEFNIKMKASKNVPMTDLVKLLMDGKDRTFIEELMKYLLYVEVKE